MAVPVDQDTGHLGAAEVDADGVVALLHMPLFGSYPLTPHGRQGSIYGVVVPVLPLLTPVQTSCPGRVSVAAGVRPAACVRPSWSEAASEWPRSPEPGGRPENSALPPPRVRSIAPSQAISRSARRSRAPCTMPPAGSSSAMSSSPS